MRNYTYYTQSKQYHAYNAKPTGLSNGATPPMSVLPNAWLHLPLSKVFSSRALSAPYFGSKSGRDEGLHCNFACLLYSKLLNRLPKTRIIEIINSAVIIEMEFVVDALPVELIGMNSSMMCDS